ncbi:MAG TPA: hypothetical protein DCZ91_23090 [Lachnospiraceae bacterium]|nr:hypothetical protein [Lachnospiraceae bacterium]
MMGKINGMEDIHELPPKVRRMYQAVIQMLEEGMEAGNLRVSTITERAGIGKGTAYEYFDSKEELVACAILYQMRCMFGWLEAALQEQETFREQLSFLLTEVDKRELHKNCFLRFLHMMTDNSEFNRMLQKKMHEEAFVPYLPMNVFAGIMRRGMERGELRKDIPMDYMVHCLFSHLLVYLMAVTAGGFFDTDPASVRPLVYQGILNELEERS